MEEGRVHLYPPTKCLLKLSPHKTTLLSQLYSQKQQVWLRAKRRNLSTPSKVSQSLSVCFSLLSLSLQEINNF